MTAVVRPQTRQPLRSDRRPSRPQLRVLDQVEVRRRIRRRRATALLCVAIVTGLFGVAFAHAKLVESQQELDEMRARIAELQNERAQLERSIDEASSAAVVYEGARRDLGMVPAEDPVYLRSVGGTDGE